MSDGSRGGLDDENRTGEWMRRSCFYVPSLVSVIKRNRRNVLVRNLGSCRILKNES